MSDTKDVEIATGFVIAGPCLILQSDPPGAEAWTQVKSRPSLTAAIIWIQAHYTNLRWISPTRALASVGILAGRQKEVAG